MESSQATNNSAQTTPNLQLGYLSSIQELGKPIRPLSREDNGYGCACDSCGGWNNIHTKDQKFQPR